jgi:hypothetical protein
MKQHTGVFAACHERQESSRRSTRPQMCMSRLGCSAFKDDSEPISHVLKALGYLIASVPRRVLQENTEPLALHRIVVVGVTKGRNHLASD